VIETPHAVPQHFDPLDWWQHLSSKRRETAREALGRD
jgi:hypothetical protein